LLFGTSGAFENWVGELSNCKSLAESRLAFAWELHYCDLYEECLTILNELLKVSSDWVAALTCKADTLIHLGKDDEAWITARRALELEPTNADAWETQGDVFERQDNWAALLQNCDAWERSGRLRRRAKRELLMHRAVAHCAMDDLSAVEVDIAAFLALITFKTPEAAVRRKKIAMSQVFRRAGKPVPEHYSLKTK
jgi:tetratricopeptide (TPR) repeat protein